MRMNRARAPAAAWLLSALFLVLSMTLAQPVAAAAPAHIENEVRQARLAGTGSFRWFGLKIYDASLWVGEQGYRAQTPAAAELALDLRYARALRGKQIAIASEEQMRKLGRGSARQRADWLAAMEKLFPDVLEGTHLSGVYLPNQGARFYLDGKFLGEIMDPEFALAFFAIWLDPATTAAQLRTALLTDAAPR